MDTIHHTTVQTNGIKLHVAAAGPVTGPPVLLLHGFPELWYSWRHQIVFLSSAGYRVIAPDLHGYGDSDAPSSSDSYTALHIVGDLVGLLDELGIEKVLLVGHDWGALIAWYFCLFRPDKIKASVILSVQFFPRNPKTPFIEGFKAVLGDQFYMVRFQEPGKAEEEFATVDIREFFKNTLSNRDPRAPYLPGEVKFEGVPPPPLAPWLTPEDIDFYAQKFSHTGFTGSLNYYRAFDRTWELTAPWTGAQIEVPVKFIVGDLDLTYHFPGAQKYIHGDAFKKDVPGLDEVIVMKDASHFINQERPHEINCHIHDFFNKFC
ncbi:epoxide hydrolase A-like [Benincasa hispida]|uniref:epoxide hydrolase A-like n=1 Tax=Benincasa hispida TaxID=102211 RepID=UPI0018FFD1A4|nr:epoxide hydrolase A-like [Benincasa hispida]